MTRCFFLGFIVLTVVVVNGQTINLHGTVSNTAGKPIVNAIVELVGQKMKDTTGADGAYSISRSTAVELPSVLPETERI